MKLCQRDCRNSNIVSLSSGRPIHLPHIQDADLVFRKEAMTIPVVCDRQHHSASKWNIFPFKPPHSPIACFNLCCFLSYPASHRFLMIFLWRSQESSEKKNRNKIFIWQRHPVPKTLSLEEHLAVLVKLSTQVLSLLLLIVPILDYFPFTSFYKWHTTGPAILVHLRMCQ